MEYERRTTWRNHTKNQSCEPLRYYRARTLADLQQIVQEAERLGCTVRAIGSGHAWSDAALTSGFMVDTHGLNRVLEIERNLLRPNRDTGGLVRTEAGIRILELNAELDRRGLALSNMGGYDGQTLGGVVSTATHGSGIEFGPLSSFVRSFDLVAEGGRVYRIEPRNGLTDPVRYAERHADRVLKQDDQWFHAALVSMGCMGIIHSAYIDVEAKYWLKEVRVLSTWDQVKADLRAGDVLRRNRHYEVCVNPHRVDGRNRCLVTTRNKVPEPRGRPKDKLERNPLTEFAASIPLIPKLINLLFDIRPRLTPESLDRALAALVDDEYSHVSYRVLNIGAANHVPAYSAEIGVPVDARGWHLDAVDRMIAIAEHRRRVGEVYATSPVALRFVKASDAYLAMMHGRDTMMIELILQTDTEGGFELLAAYEDALYALGGRPHWGQVNTLTGSHDFVASMYPRYSDWLDVRQQLDPRGTFDGPFTKRTGISRARFTA